VPGQEILIAYVAVISAVRHRTPLHRRPLSP
jgi:hypothetical protein